MEGHGRDVGLTGSVQDRLGYQGLGQPRSTDEWAFPSVDEATKGADRRHRDFVEEHPLTEADLCQVDARAIGNLTADAIQALHVGRREGTAGPSFLGYLPSPHEEALGAAYFDDQIEAAFDTGLHTTHGRGYQPIPIRAATQEDPAMSAYLDNDLEDPTDLEDPAKPKLICPGVVSTPHPRRLSWNKDGSFGLLVKDLPEVGSVEDVYQGAGLKQREGDQPLPEVNDEPHIHDLVIEDIRDRKRLGIARYGTALQPFNGRDAGRDMVEEALDLAVYAKQVQIESEVMQAHLDSYLEQIEDFQGLIEDIRMILDWDERPKDMIRAIRAELAEFTRPI